MTVPPAVCDVPSYLDLLVIRHAETQWNTEDRLQGSNNDSPLTLNGVRQAFALAVTMHAHVPVADETCFWVSPLGRAKQTASILAGAWELPFRSFRVDAALAERSYGKWEGHTLDEVAREFPVEFWGHKTDPWGYHIPGGESRDQFAQRISNWLSELDKSVPHVAVVHSGCLRAIRATCTQASRDEVMQYREPQTTAFWLSGGRETAINVDPTVLQIFGCRGRGKTVAI